MRRLGCLQIKDSSYLVLHGFNVLFALSAFAFKDVASIWAISYVFCFALFVVALLRHLENVLCFSRTFFLCIVGLLAAGVKLIGPNIMFGYHMPESQTVDIAMTMFLATILGFVGSEIGFLGAKRFPIKSVRINTFASNSKATRFVIVGVFFLVSIVAGYTIAKHSGGVVFDSAYNPDSKTDLPINNLNCIANIAIYCLCAVAVVTRSKRYTIIFVLCCAYVLGYCQFMRGVRMDVINGILGCYVTFCLLQKRSPALKVRQFIMLVPAFLIIQVMGAVRDVFSAGLVTPENIGVALSVLVSPENTAGIAFYQGTINDIATTFSGTVYLLKHAYILPLWGRSYFDYLLRTPPEFMAPNRPADLAFVFQDMGFTSGGGFFELAEAYLNFGLIGCLFIPAAISFGIGVVYKRASRVGGLISYFFLFAIMSVWMRGLLYMTFSFWKAIVTALLMVGAYSVVSRPIVALLVRRREVV